MYNFLIYPQYYKPGTKDDGWMRPDIYIKAESRKQAAIDCLPFVLEATPPRLLSRIPPGNNITDVVRFFIGCDELNKHGFVETSVLLKDPF
jgi:hypothetical protein